MGRGWRGGGEKKMQRRGGGKEGDERVLKQVSPTSCLLLPYVWVSTCSPQSKHPNSERGKGRHD